MPSLSKRLTYLAVSIDITPEGPFLFFTDASSKHTNKKRDLSEDMHVIFHYRDGSSSNSNTSVLLM